MVNGYRKTMNAITGRNLFVLKIYFNSGLKNLTNSSINLAY